MPMFNKITALSRDYSVIAVNPDKYFFKKKLSILIGIFYLSGEPISPHLLRCGPFAVENHSRGQALSS
jgi:hypothetical protein